MGLGVFEGFMNSKVKIARSWAETAGKSKDNYGFSNSGTFS